MLDSTIITQSINQNAKTLYERFWNPATWPQWVSGLATTGLQQDDKGWKFQSSAGECRMTFTDHNTFGIMDHWVEVAGQPVVFAPLRVVPNGDGCDVQLTLFRQPGVDDERFEGDKKLVKQDLEALKKLAEGS